MVQVTTTATNSVREEITCILSRFGRATCFKVVLSFTKVLSRSPALLPFSDGLMPVKNNDEIPREVWACPLFSTRSTVGTRAPFVSGVPEEAVLVASSSPFAQETHCDIVSAASFSHEECRARLQDWLGQRFLCRHLLARSRTRGWLGRASRAGRLPSSKERHLAQRQSSRARLYSVGKTG